MLQIESLIDIALNSTASQHRVAAACYTKKGKLIATAVNQPKKSHPRQAYYAKMAGQESRIFLHAELACIIRCKEDPFSIQIVRIGPKKYPKPSWPCRVCLMAIEEAGIKEIYYNNNKGENCIELL